MHTRKDFSYSFQTARKKNHLIINISFLLVILVSPQQICAQKVESSTEITVKNKLDSVLATFYIYLKNKLQYSSTVIFFHVILYQIFYLVRVKLIDICIFIYYN